MGAGAMGHMETSLFEQCGYSREAIQARLERNWYEMFEGPDKIYWENDEGLGYVMDTGNHDVRTEGMSYAMMIAVQYGRKDVFDKLWGWVMKYMFMTEGLHQATSSGPWTPAAYRTPTVRPRTARNTSRWTCSWPPRDGATVKACTSTPATSARSSTPACTRARTVKAIRCGTRRTI